MAGVVALGLGMVLNSTALGADMETLKIEWPNPTIKGTPDSLPVGPTVEPLMTNDPALFMVPKGVVNVAKGKTVTASDKPFTGEFSFVTDGDREAQDESVLEIRKGVCWTAVDLGKEYSIAAIAVWNDHRYYQVYYDVIIQIADDAAFTKNLRTLYNNDLDNSSKQGIGTDKEYIETRWGKVVNAKGEKARYVRTFTKGGSLSAGNSRQEIEVYAVEK